MPGGLPQRPLHRLLRRNRSRAEGDNSIATSKLWPRLASAAEWLAGDTKPLVRGGVILEEATNPATPQVPAVDVSSAPYAMTRTYAGVSVRSAQRWNWDMQNPFQPWTIEESCMAQNPPVLVPVEHEHPGTGRAAARVPGSRTQKPERATPWSTRPALNGPPGALTWPESVPGAAAAVPGRPPPPG